MRDHETRYYYRLAALKAASAMYERALLQRLATRSRINYLLDNQPDGWRTQLRLASNSLERAKFELARIEEMYGDALLLSDAGPLWVRPPPRSGA